MLILGKEEDGDPFYFPILKARGGKACFVAGLGFDKVTKAPFF
jgi:hypothetical protein